MMFALTVLRILLALSLVFVLCSAQKSFLKGLLIGSLLGHKKGNLFHEGKGESKDVHHYEKEYVPMPVEKEYIPVPVHEEPKFIPVYIVKECSKKSYDSSYNPVLHHHDHHHNYNYDDNKLSDLSEIKDGYEAGDVEGEAGDEYGYASASKYRGTLDGYSESQFKPVRNKPNLTNRGTSTKKAEASDNNIGIVLSLHKEVENKY